MAVGGTMAAMGVIIVLVVIIAHRRGKASRFWPQADGTILESDVFEKGDDGPRARIVYEYAVGDTCYVSKAVTYDMQRESIEETLDRYREKAAVRVYYDPVKPQVAVLEPGVCPLPAVVVFVCLGLI